MEWTNTGQQYMQKKQQPKTSGCPNGSQGIWGNNVMMASAEECQFFLKKKVIIPLYEITGISDQLLELVTRRIWETWDFLLVSKGLMAQTLLVLFKEQETRNNIFRLQGSLYQFDIKKIS